MSKLISVQLKLHAAHLFGVFKLLLIYIQFRYLTLSMPRLLSSKAQGRKGFGKLSKPYHVGIHWIALAEHSQMSTHVPGFHSFFSFFASFCIGQISHQQHKG